MERFVPEFYDEVAIRNSYDGQELVKSLTIRDVERFLRSLGVDSIDVCSNYLICPTICHNPIDEAESMKLYYYDETKNFHCYTQCSENFNIIELYRRYMALNHQEVDYNEALNYLRQFLSLEENEIEPNCRASYKEEIKTVKKDIITLPEVNKNVLDVFIPYAHPLWLKEGLDEKAQFQFGIRFSYFQNKIIIPHYDINGRLVGIRCRAIEEEDLEYGKYRPVQIGDTMYNHQLGFNLYGIWEHKKAIQMTKRAVIYEGEKSVILDTSYYGPYSVAVATCGSQLNRFQINLLIKELGVNEITLAYDKEYDAPYSEEGKKYREKLINKCSKYLGLANFYYVFDEHGFLNKKDAPCDKGKETLEKLMKRRIKII